MNNLWCENVEKINTNVISFISDWVNESDKFTQEKIGLLRRFGK